jgi:hypothetical protein
MASQTLTSQPCSSTAEVWTGSTAEVWLEIVQRAAARNVKPDFFTRCGQWLRANWKAAFASVAIWFGCAYLALWLGR